MTEPTAPDTLDSLRARAESLERQLREAMESSNQRLIHAELKAEAVRAGMIDLDGLKLINTADLRLSDKGGVEGAADLMKRLRTSKPWLFGAANTSSPAAPPPSSPPQPKRATDMTDEEWRSARAELLRNARLPG
jgi:hypothetical protein